ncbi:ornithine cyclodeaminase family protein [Segnochrobactrum spirostomi]|nr:ornithine cyclodeaminase [Segnochrobactrum spirostomi]
MLHIDADSLTATIPPAELVADLAAGHREGIDVIERLLLTEERGPEAANHLLIWSSWAYGRGVSAKLAAVFPDNERRGRGPTVRTVFVLFDGDDGAPRCVITGDQFTRCRTAADSALASTFLSREESRVLVVVGAGAQAETHVRFHCAVRPSIDRILIWNRTRAKAEALAARLADLGRPVAVADDLAAAVAEADIVTSLTATREPLIQGVWLKPGTHLDLVGGFKPDMREADDEAIRRATLFADTRRFTLGDCGDFTQAMARGAMREADLSADLFDLCTGEAPGRTGDDQITLFKNGGGGHLDLIIGRALYRRAAG